MKECDRNILTALQMAEEMLSLADKGDLDREDDSCGVLYAFMRDSAYKIMQMANRERDQHIKAGKWTFDKTQNNGLLYDDNHREKQ